MAIKHSLLGASTRTQSKGDGAEAIRLSKELHGFVQPLLDWYQFKSSDHLAYYLVKICDLDELHFTYSKARHLISGEIKYHLDNELKWIHSTMRRMHEAALMGRREPVPLKLKDKYIFSNDEPLHDLIARSLVGFTGAEDQRGVEGIERILADANKVRQPSGLVQRLEKTYGFANPQKTQEFLADVAGIGDINVRYMLLNLIGQRKNPSNYHRKMFAVASVLDYAWRNGHNGKAIIAILERGRIRSTMERGHVTYLAVSRLRYLTIIRQMERHGLKGHVLGTILSEVLGITLGNAKKNYAVGSYNVMDLNYYRKLKEFIDNALPNIYVVDLNDERKRQNEIDKFLESYSGGRVLVIYDGPANEKVGRMVENIRDVAHSRLGFAFLFDKHRVIKVAGVHDYSDLLMMSKYSRKSGFPLGNLRG